MGSEAPLSIKYQQQFPGVGDPYTTEETIERRLYYNINGIPRVRINGNFWEVSAVYLELEKLQQASDPPALVTIDGGYDIDAASQTVTGSVKLTSSCELTEGTRLMIAIVETQNFNNVMDNGETTFDHVLKKFWPNENGISLEGLEKDEEFSTDFSYTFPGDYVLPENGSINQRLNLEEEHCVEEFENLFILAWVEQTEDKYVLDASSLGRISSTTVEVRKPNIQTLNVSKGLILLSEDISIDRISLTNMAGQKLIERSYENGQLINTYDLPFGMYIIQAYSGNEMYLVKIAQ